MAERPIDVVRRWEDGGAEWRVVLLADDRVEIELCTCTGEPVERLMSSDRDLIELAREREPSQ
jgi:hypothetical protein